jgi:hypothetical protein
MIETPLILGPFLVESDGTLRPREKERAVRFSFRWRAYPFFARLEEESLALEARLGRLPSSAEGDGAVRRGFFERFPTLRHLVPAPWTVSLTPSHTVTLNAPLTLPLPARISGLLTLLGAEVLRLAPYLELFESCGLSPPWPAEGKRSVSPG